MKESKQQIKRKPNEIGEKKDEQAELSKVDKKCNVMENIWICLPLICAENYEWKWTSCDG